MSTRMRVGLALTIAFSLLFVFSVRGQRGDRRRSRIPDTSAVLATVTRLDCSLSAATTATWENGAAKVQTSTQTDGARVTIERIDVQDGTAEIRGSFRGGDNVNVKLVGSNLHFLDVSLDGGLTVITVFPRETHDGRLQAVLSRAAFPEAAQYYGDCAAAR